MTNRTQIFSFQNTSLTLASGSVTTAVNAFVVSGIALGYTDFCIRPAVIINPDVVTLFPIPVPLTPFIPLVGPGTDYRCTVEVDYYDPAIM